MAGSQASSPEMQTFLREAEECATNIKNHYSTWEKSVAPLDASKGLFAAAFLETKQVVNMELNNISNLLQGISVDVSVADKNYQAADAEQDEAIKKAQMMLRGSSGGSSAV